MSPGFGRLFRSKRSSRRLPDELPPNALEPGRSYLLKVSSAGAHICIFQGVEDGLFRFSVLRHDEGTNILRWPEARYLGGDFHAYAAFDEHYNPNVEFWYELGTNGYQPMEWFVMFDEAYRKECEALARREPPPQQEHSIQLPYLTRNHETPQSIKEENNAQLFLDLFNREERHSRESLHPQPPQRQSRSRKPSIRQFLMRRVAPTPPPHE